MATITLEEFKATARKVSIKEGADLIGIEARDFGPDAVAIWLFDGLTFGEEMANGQFHALVIQDEYLGDFNGLAAFLFFEHHCSECVDGKIWTDAALCDLLESYAEYAELPLVSADDLLADLTMHPAEFRKPENAAQGRKVAWLQWFSGMWENMELRQQIGGLGDGG